MNPKRDYSEAKRKELETRARLGPRLGRPSQERRGPTAEPMRGRPVHRTSGGMSHPTRDSGDE